MFARFAKLALLGILAALVVAGCSSSSTTDPGSQPTARVRVVHVSTDFGPVDVYLNSESAPRISGMEYLDAGVYFSFNTPTTISLHFRRAGDPATATPLFSYEDVDVASGSSITAVACGLFSSSDDADNLRLLWLQDQWLAHATGESRVRTVNASADAGELTVTISGGAILAGNLGRFLDSGLGGEPYPAGTTDDVNVFDQTGVASYPAPTLAADADYYYIFTGLLGSTNADGFTMLAVGPGGAEDPRAPAWTESETRVVHASPDLGQVDVYLVQGLGARETRTPVTAGLAYGGSSPWGAIDGRAAILHFYAAGADPDTDPEIFGRSIDLPAENSSVTALVAGLRDNNDPTDMLRVLDMADVFVSAPAGQFPVRYVHAVSDAATVLVDVGDDGPEEATLTRFEVSEDLALPQNTSVTIALREGGATLGVFTTPAYSETGGHYLVFTGLKAGSPGIQLLSISPTAVLGFTDPGGF